MKPATQCCEQVWPGRGWHPSQCSRTGTVQRGGKYYCKTHDPEAKKAREEKRDARYRKEEAEFSEKIKRYNAYPRLVAALKNCLVAFAEMKPKEEDYQNVNNAALLLKELGE